MATGIQGEGKEAKKQVQGRDWQNFLSQGKLSAFAFHQAATDRAREGGLEASGTNIMQPEGC